MDPNCSIQLLNGTRKLVFSTTSLTPTEASAQFDEMMVLDREYELRLYQLGTIIRIKNFDGEINF